MTITIRFNQLLQSLLTGVHLGLFDVKSFARELLVYKDEVFAI